MTDLTPYAAPADVIEAEQRSPQRVANRLWLGFLLAPMVGPALASLVVTAIMLLLADLQDSDSAFGILFIAMVTFLAGAMLTYALTLFLGAPIILLLRATNRLNGYTLLLSAVVLTLAAATGTNFVNIFDDDVLSTITTIAATFLSMAPFGFASTAVFWWLAIRQPSDDSIRPAFK